MEENCHIKWLPAKPLLIVERLIIVFWVLGLLCGKGIIEARSVLGIFFSSNMLKYSLLKQTNEASRELCGG